jgi:hypothetical protein
VNAALVAISLLALSGPGEEVSGVKASDLGTRVRVIGSLGVPLGERVRIRGEWYVPKGVKLKADSLALRVTEVNGKRIEKEVSLPDWDINSVPFDRRGPARKSGEEWEAEGYESGQFYGEPEWVTREVYGLDPAGRSLKFKPTFWYIIAPNEKESPISK